MVSYVGTYTLGSLIWNATCLAPAVTFNTSKFVPPGYSSQCFYLVASNFLPVFDFRILPGCNLELLCLIGLFTSWYFSYAVNFAATGFTCIIYFVLFCYHCLTFNHYFSYLIYIVGVGFLFNFSNTLTSMKT